MRDLPLARRCLDLLSDLLTSLAPASAHFHLRTMSARTCERSFSPALLRRWKNYFHLRQRVNARKGPKRVTFTPRPPFEVYPTSRPPRNS